MSQRYSFIDAIFLSLYSQSLYRDVVRHWKGRGFKYLLLLVFVISLVLSGISLYQLYRFSTEQKAKQLALLLFDDTELTFEQSLNRLLGVAAQIPDARFEDGRLVTPEEKPYILEDPLTHNTLAMIDTSGAYTSTQESTALLLLTSRYAAVKTPGQHASSRERLLPYSELATGTINLAAWNVVFELFSQWPELAIQEATLIAKNRESDHRDYPLHLKISQLDGTVVVIDPEDSYASPDEAGAFLLLGSKQVSVYNLAGSGEENAPGFLTFPYDTLSPATIYQGFEYVLNWAKRALFILIPLSTIPSVMLLGFLSGIVMVLAYSLIGLMIARYLAVALSYQQMLRLCCVSITPVLTASIVLPQFLSRQGLVYFLIAVGYLYYAIRAQTTGSQKGGVPDGNSSGQ